MEAKEKAIDLFNKLNKIKHSVSTHVQKKGLSNALLLRLKR